MYRTETRLPLVMDMGMMYDWECWLAYSRKHYGQEWTPQDLARTIRYVRANRYLGPYHQSFKYLIREPSNFAERWVETQATARAPKMDPGKAQALRESGRPADATPPQKDPQQAAQAAQRAIDHLKAFKKEQGWE